MTDQTGRIKVLKNKVECIAEHSNEILCDSAAKD